MERKTKKINNEKLEARKRLEEIERLEQEAQAEETTKVQVIEQSIAKICAENEMFCGIILTPKDILAVVELAMKSGENVRIPFKLYFND